MKRIIQTIIFKLRSSKALLPFLFTKPVKDLVIVSGADSSHCQSLRQFLTSVRKYEVATKVIVFDLGLKGNERQELLAAFPFIELRVFDYAQYPAYFNLRINRGEYAWKPVIVADVLDEYKCAVCWMDAGNVLTGSLWWLRKIINSSGFYSPKSSGLVQDWTHPKTLEYLGASHELLGKHNLNGACVAANYTFNEVVKLIRDWRACAEVKECIAPEGSSRQNHRQDQAILTVLAHQVGVTKKIPTAFLGFKTHQDFNAVPTNHS
jgi:hypothetical protein